MNELKALFLEEARKYYVLPLDASVATRLVAPRPNITAGRSEFTYTRPITGIPQGDSPLAFHQLLAGEGATRVEPSPDKSQVAERLAKET